MATSKLNEDIKKELIGHIQQTCSIYYSQWWNTENISSKTRSRTRVLTLINTIQYNFGSLSHSNQRRQKIKGIQTGKEVKLSLLSDDIILFIENFKDGSRKLLVLINEYSKVTDTKLMHRNPLHSYTLTIRNQKEKLRKQSHSLLQQKEYNF